MCTWALPSCTAQAIIHPSLWKGLYCGAEELEIAQIAWLAAVSPTVNADSLDLLQQ